MYNSQYFWNQYVKYGNMITDIENRIEEMSDYIVKLTTANQYVENAAAYMKSSSTIIEETTSINGKPYDNHEFKEYGTELDETVEDFNNIIEKTNTKISDFNDDITSYTTLKNNAYDNYLRALAKE